MWVRLLLDIQAVDIAHAYSTLFSRTHFPAADLGRHFCSNSLAFPCLSVRSGLTLLLETLGWPAESEVVFSALNIPDMAMVVRHHGLVPVPADLDLDTLAPNLDRLEEAITPRTKALLIAHLYGCMIDLDPIIDLARRHGLLVIEDCAEIYDGTYPGHPEADISLFSFGPLKTATALAGGMVRVREADLLRRMRVVHDQWHRQSRWDYFRRITKYGFMRLCGEPYFYGAVRRAIELAVGDVDKMIHHSAKSFREDELIRRLRQQPSAPLLAVLQRRLRHYQRQRIERRTANGRLLAELLRGHVYCPGANVDRHNFWLFPAMVDDPDGAIAALAQSGFDVTQASSMRAVDTPPGRSHLDPAAARQALKKIILLPCYPEMPRREIERMASALIAWRNRQSHLTSMKVRLTDSHRAAALRLWPAPTDADSISASA